MNNEILKTIRYHIKEKLLITIERNQIEEEVLYGFPLFVNSEILIMTKIYDFRDEGILVLKLSEISDAYSKESDVFFEKICKYEGLDMIINPFPTCETMYDILLIIDTDVQYITVQCEKNESELYFSIGRIEEVTSTAVIMKTFDACGQWEPGVRIIPYEEITMISIGDHYSKTYYKYMSVFDEESD